MPMRNLNHTDSVISIYGHGVTPQLPPSYLLFSLLFEWGSLGNIGEYDVPMVATRSNFLCVVVLRDLSDLGHLSRNIMPVTLFPSISAARSSFLFKKKERPHA